MRKMIWLSFVLMFASLPLRAAIYCVATNATPGASRDTWGNAYTNIQDALNAARSNDTIYLAGHTFPLTAQLSWTGLASHVTIRGGYTATNPAIAGGENNPTLWPTTIKQTGADRVMYIAGVTNGTLQNVVLTGGNLPSGSWRGGGLLITNTINLKLDSSTIISNRLLAATEGIWGGGIFSTANTELLITNCLIRENSAVLTGAGNNICGGLYHTRGTMRLVDSEVSLNACMGPNANTASGAAIFNYIATMELRNCRIWGNVMANAQTGTGNIHNYNVSGNAMTLLNCTVAYNYGGGLANGTLATAAATNSIFWQNSDDIVGNIRLVASNIRDGDSNGVAGCISEDPRFEYGAYLGSGSPCVNQGTNNAADLGLSGYTTSADGASDSGRVDMGFHYRSGITPYANLYVAPNGANTVGTNGATAFTSITRALSEARDDTRIHVAAGNYTNLLETFPLTIKNRGWLELIGTNAASTIINASGANTRGLFIDQAGWFKAHGFTITGANSPDINGGGIYVQYSGESVFSSCLIVSNRTGTASGARGGGLYAANNIVVTITNGQIRSNLASATGNFHMGGGIHIAQGAVLNCFNSEISMNTATGTAASSGYGGGIGNGGSVLLRNCLILSNNVYNASGIGGAFWNAIATSASLFENCTMVANQAKGIYVSAGKVAATNTIFWYNGDDLNGAATVFRCAIQSTDTFWTNNVNGCFTNNPLFAGAATNNYRLTADSPCKDKGTNLPWVATAFDLDGKKRLAGLFVDIGAYELQGPQGTMITFQ